MESKKKHVKSVRENTHLELAGTFNVKHVMVPVMLAQVVMMSYLGGISSRSIQELNMLKQEMVWKTWTATG